MAEQLAHPTGETSGPVFGTWAAHLDGYITGHIGTGTTRRRSERDFACPPLGDAALANHAMRNILTMVYSAPEYTAIAVTRPEGESLTQLRTRYWQDARLVTTAHGARPDFSLDNYFHVPQDHHYGAVRDRVLEEYPEQSIPASLLRGIETYRGELDLAPPVAARVTMALFAHCLPLTKQAATSLIEQGHSETDAATQAVGAFVAQAVPYHISRLAQHRGTVMLEPTAVYGRDLYPPVSTDEPNSVAALRLTRHDAEGLMRVYHLQERPYSAQDLGVAEQLVRLPKTQQAMLLFHQDLVKRSEIYLARHPEHTRHSLEPFSEMFIPHPEHGPAVLIPNPKLIKTIATNILPAIANVHRQTGQPLEALTGEAIRTGVRLAQRLGVYHAQLGSFKNYDPTTDTVDISDIFSLCCPAVRVFSDSLLGLADIYDSLPAKQK